MPSFKKSLIVEQFRGNYVKGIHCVLPFFIGLKYYYYYQYIIRGFINSENRRAFEGK